MEEECGCSRLAGRLAVLSWARDRYIPTNHMHRDLRQRPGSGHTLSWRHKPGSCWPQSDNQEVQNPAEHCVSELGYDSLPDEPPDETPATALIAAVRAQAGDPVKPCLDS